MGVTVPLLLGLSWAGNQYGWSELPVVVSLAVAGALLVAFVAQARRAKEPVLPLYLFRNRVYAVSVVTTMVLGAGMFGAMQFLPLFLVGVQGFSTTNSGLVMMPMMLGMVFGSVVTGQLLSRGRDLRLLAIFGGAALLSGFYLLSTMEMGSSAWTTRGYMVLLGLGMGFWMPTFQLAVQNALPHQQLGVGTASVNFFRQIGGTFSVAVLGSLLASTFKTNLSNAVPAQFGEILSDPQRLLSTESVERLTAAIEQQSPGASESVLTAARVALSDSVTGIFLVGVGIVAVGIAIGLLMPRVRMRGREELMAEARGEAPPDDGEGEGEEAGGGFGVEPEEAGAPGE